MANQGHANNGGGSREAASERAQNSGVLKLRGLPFSSNKQNVQEFFEGTRGHIRGLEGVGKREKAVAERRSFSAAMHCAGPGVSRHGAPSV